MSITKKNSLRLALAIIVIGLFCWYIVDNWSRIVAISIEHPWLLVLTIPVVILSILSSGAINEIAIEPHGVKVTRKELFGLASINRFTNQFAPSYVAASVRAVYFKKQHNVSYAKFSSSFAVSNVLQLVISGVLAIVAYALVSFSDFQFQGIAAIAITLAILLVAMFLPMGPFSRLLTSLYRRFPNKPLERLSVLPEEFAKVRSHKGLLLRLVGWILTMVISSGVLVWLIYASLGASINPLSALFIGALGSWGLVLSITPGGLGIREGIMAFAAHLLGIDVTTTIVVALIMRISVSAVSGILFLYYSRKMDIKT